MDVTVSLKKPRVHFFMTQITFKTIMVSDTTCFIKDTVSQTREIFKNRLIRTISYGGIIATNMALSTTHYISSILEYSCTNVLMTVTRFCCFLFKKETFFLLLYVYYTTLKIKFCSVKH